MKLVVGLGNPGPRYEVTRHNVGFLALDYMIEKWGARGPEQKYNAEVYTATIGDEKVLLMKPQTFMNLSGKSVGPAFQFHKLAPTDLIVLHDELDLDPLALRFKAGGGTGGHNGLKSIDAHVGNQNNGYFRVRIGIGHPSRSVEHSRMDVADYVLNAFSDQECAELEDVFSKTAQAVEWMITEGTAGLNKAMNRIHTTSKKESK